VGTFVLDNDFRHPAATAKEAATLDVLTDGRFELGIGAGWNPADYQKTGQVFEPAGIRVTKLEEALHIVKAFFDGESTTVTFHGRHYQVDNLDALPRTVQQPRPPILLGAAGRRMLSLAAREADILNFPDRPSVGVSTAGNPGLGLTVAEQMAIVREAAGERYGKLELSSLSIPRLTEHVSDTIERLASQMQTTPAVVQDMPGALVGTLEAIVEKLQSSRERFDLSYIVLPGAAIDDFAPVVERLAGT
jgi:probable F420-dependent oxidoreductase